MQCADYEPPRRLNRSIPRALEAVCQKAMALRPDDRYPSAGTLAHDIERWLADEPVSAFREPWPARLARWARRHRPLITGMAALLVTAVVALAVSTILIGNEKRREQVQRKLAEVNFSRAREAVNQMLSEVGEIELAEVPQMEAAPSGSWRMHSAFTRRLSPNDLPTLPFKSNTAVPSSGWRPSRTCWETPARPRRRIGSRSPFSRACRAHSRHGLDDR